jgi:AbrB family looped-hinge helix DNA binding protein
MAMMKIDKQGRVVIPSPLRDRLGLGPKSSLLVEEVAEGLLVRPAGENVPLEEGASFAVETLEKQEVVIREDALRPLERAAIFKRLAS